MSHKAKPTAPDDDQPSPARRAVLQAQRDRADAVADAADTDVEADLAPTDGRPYSVGYGKPPISTRFKPGQSGNPKGRRKGTKNFGKMVHDTVFEKVTVNTPRGRRKLPGLQVVVTRTLNQALQGDAKAIDRLLKILQYAGIAVPAAQEHDQAAAQELSAEDQAILDRVLGPAAMP